MRNQMIEILEEPETAEAEYPNIYAAIPSNGVPCPHTGLKHAHLYKLLGEDGAARNFVRVVNLRNPRARHGKTLFNVGDMLRFLDHLAREQGAGSDRQKLSVVPAQGPGVSSAAATG
jgi:hypothetical protein